MKDNLVRVFLYGKEICRLIWKGGYKEGWGKVGAAITFNENYIDYGFDVDPLGKYRNSSFLVRSGFTDICREKDDEGLPRFLSSSLPDKWGNQVFSSWVERNKLHKHEINSVDKLAFIGKRGMGGFEFYPELYSPESDDTVCLEDLFTVAQEIEKSREEAIVMLKENTSVNDLMAVGMSAGGKHPKAIVAIDWNTMEVRSGQMLLPDNFTQYILKFKDSENWPTAELEYTYYQMARECGITMENSQLLTIGGVNHFLTERFDRKNCQKLHSTTLYALAGEVNTYEEIFTVCRKLQLPKKDIEQLFRRAVFNYLACVCDDHDKNFSFILTENGKWRLSPAYDEIFTLDFVNRFKWDRHSMMIDGCDRHVSEEQLLKLAKDNDVSNSENILEEVSEIVRTFSEKAAKNGIESPYIDFVEKQLQEHTISQSQENRTKWW